jgi:16S rRNA processing protein RimM
MHKEDCFYLGKIAKKFSGESPCLFTRMNLSYTKTWNQCLLNATNTWFLIENSSAQKRFLRIRFDMNNEEPMP